MTNKEIKKKFEFDLNITFENSDDLVCFNTGLDPITLLNFVSFLKIFGYSESKSRYPLRNFESYFVILDIKNKLFTKFMTKSFIPKSLNIYELPDYIKEYKGL